MPDPARKPWTVAEFFAWQAVQAERHELVGGLPVRLMAGARNVHGDIVVNLLAELRAQTRGGGCRPFTGDGSIETIPGQVRRPDVGVDCGRRDPDALQAALPRMVAEVLSPTTRDFDAFEKLAEYKTVAALDYIMLVEPNAAEIALWSREQGGAWARRIVEGVEEVVEMPGIGVALALAEAYDGVEFPPRLRLAHGTPDASS